MKNPNQSQPKTNQPLVLVFTGNGKGKSSAALGTIIRALGWEKKVILIRIFKGWWDTGESRFLKKLHQQNKYFSMFDFPVKTWVDKRTNQKVQDKNNQMIITKAVSTINSQLEKGPFLLVVDEILVAYKFGYITTKQIKTIAAKAKSNNSHLLLTGRGWEKELTKFADVVTEMKEVKHVFEKDESAVKGIDW